MPPYFFSLCIDGGYWFVEKNVVLIWNHRYQILLQIHKHSFGLYEYYKHYTYRKHRVQLDDYLAYYYTRFTPELE